jgi:hypothetical protein
MSVERSPQPAPALITPVKPSNFSSSFSLTVTQVGPRIPFAIARISRRAMGARTAPANPSAQAPAQPPTQPANYGPEEWLGDYRYSLASPSLAQSRLAKPQPLRSNSPTSGNVLLGANVGDRIVVRLFDAENNFVGYSEFEVQAKNSVITLVMGERQESEGVVRTLQGLDIDYNGTMDNGSALYDYFTHVFVPGMGESASTLGQPAAPITAATASTAQVKFLSFAQDIDLSNFTLVGLPRPLANCQMPISFVKGPSKLVNQPFNVFSPRTASPAIATPTGSPNPGAPKEARRP